MRHRRNGAVAIRNVATGVCRRCVAAAGVCNVARSIPTSSFFYTASAWVAEAAGVVGDGVRHATSRRRAAAPLSLGEGGFPPRDRHPHAGIAHEAGVAGDEGDRRGAQDGGMVADFVHFALDRVAGASLGDAVAAAEPVSLQIPPLSVTERAASGRFVPEVDVGVGVQIREFFQRRVRGAGAAVKGGKKAAKRTAVQNGAEFG